MSSNSLSQSNFKALFSTSGQKQKHISYYQLDIFVRSVQEKQNTNREPLGSASI